MFRKKLSRLEIMAGIIWLALLAAGPIQAGTLSRDFREICQTGSITELNAALERGADVNAADDSGWTPLMLVSSGQVELAPAKAERLLAAGADPNRKNASEETALHLAVGSGNPDLVGLLLKAGAEVDAADDFGFTPLMEVCRKSADWPEGLQESLVKQLLEAGADAGRRNDQGQSALDLARRNKTPDAGKMVALLEAAGKPAPPAEK